MQSSGKNTNFRIERSNPDFLMSLEALPKKIQREVERVEETQLMIDPFPRPNSKLIVELRGRYRDIYRIIVARKYRYIYRVEGTTIYSRFVSRRGNATYADIF